MKNKSHMISTNAQKAFDKIQHLFMQKKKNFQQGVYRRNIPQQNKGHIGQATSYSVVKAKKRLRIY